MTTEPTTVTDEIAAMRRIVATLAGRLGVNVDYLTAAADLMD